jgi:uncharacterized membrane protein
VSEPSSPPISINRPARIFAVLGPLFGLLYVFATPPFQSPDEPQHFYRAYQVSELGLIGRRMEGDPAPRAGGALPKSLKRAADRALDDIPHNLRRHVDPQALASAWAVPLDPADREFLDFPTNVLYSPVPYAPQALGLFLGRLFHARPLVLLALARLFNLGAWLALVLTAIRVTPVFRWVFLLLALSPMSIAQAASASADALTNGAAFALIAAILAAAFSPEPALRRSRFRLPAILAVVVSLCKPVYGLLPILILIIPASKFGSARRARKTAAALLAVCWGTLAAWSAAVSHLAVPLQPGVSSRGQIRFILTQPPRFLSALAHARYSAEHIREFVGQLGWLDVSLPMALIVLFYVLLVFTALSDKTAGISIPRAPKLLGSALVLGGAAVIATTIYIVWNPVGAAGIEGVQGRYLIPFGPLLVLPLYNLKIPPLLEKNRFLPAVLAGFSAFALAFGLFALLTRYYASFA